MLTAASSNPPTAYSMPLIAVPAKAYRAVGMDALVVQVLVLGSYASTVATTMNWLRTLLTPPAA